LAIARRWDPFDLDENLAFQGFQRRRGLSSFEFRGDFDQHSFPRLLHDFHHGRLLLDACVHLQTDNDWQITCYKGAVANRIANIAERGSFSQRVTMENPRLGAAEDLCCSGYSSSGSS
jgi:hypothetical protein